MLTEDASEQIQFISNVLSINDDFADPYAGLWEQIWWRCDGDYAPVTFFMNCNDLFYWACADAVKITPDNFAAIKQSVCDVAAVLDACDPRDKAKRGCVDFDESWNLWQSVGRFASSLFCARIRGMRPQQPCYKSYPDAVKVLFDACGPERDV